MHVEEIRVAWHAPLPADPEVGCEPVHAKQCCSPGLMITPCQEQSIFLVQLRREGSAFSLQVSQDKREVTKHVSLMMWHRKLCCGAALLLQDQLLMVLLQLPSRAVDGQVD